MKLVVKEPSEKRKRRQLLPTPAKINCHFQERHKSNLALVIYRVDYCNTQTIVKPNDAVIMLATVSNKNYSLQFIGT